MGAGGRSHELVIGLTVFMWNSGQFLWEHRPGELYRQFHHDRRRIDGYWTAIGPVSESSEGPILHRSVNFHGPRAAREAHGRCLAWHSDIVWFRHSSLRYLFEQYYDSSVATPSPAVRRVYSSHLATTRDINFVETTKTTTPWKSSSSTRNKPSCRGLTHSSIG